jgi:hypothetical protein
MALPLWLMLISANAQDLNWEAVRNEGQHFVGLKFGADYATVMGLSYGQRLPSKRQSFLAAEFSTPFGRDLLDDWKLRFSYQRELWQQGHFSLGLKPGLIMRGYESNVAKVLNIGIDLSAALGYYRPKWMLAAEVKIDHTLASKLNHQFLKEVYPEIYNGWIGSTGGNLKVGAQFTRTVGGQQVALRIGKVYAQNFKDNPTLPFYFELSLLKLW